MSFAFSTFWNEIEACQAADDQHCQTETIRTLHGDTDYLPATVGWMEQAHGDLRSALEVMLDLNERSEVEEITPAFLSESQAAVAELARAIDEWIITAEQ